MCSERQGLHIMEPFFLVEVLDLETASREVAEGELGTAVVTPLGRRSFPMIRFNTKDVVRKGRSGCGCGRTSLKIQEVAGRSDHLRKVRGVLFTPVAVEELVRGEFPEIPEYEIVVQKQGVMDEISLRFETIPRTGRYGPARDDGAVGRALESQDQSAFPAGAGSAGGAGEIHAESQTVQGSQVKG